MALPSATHITAKGATTTVKTMMYSTVTLPRRPPARRCLRSMGSADSSLDPTCPGAGTAARELRRPRERGRSSTAALQGGTQTGHPPGGVRAVDDDLQG